MYNCNKSARAMKAPRAALIHYCSSLSHVISRSYKTTGADAEPACRTFIGLPIGIYQSAIKCRRQ